MDHPGEKEDGGSCLVNLLSPDMVKIYFFHPSSQRILLLLFIILSAVAETITTLLIGYTPIQMYFWC